MKNNSNKVKYHVEIIENRIHETGGLLQKLFKARKDLLGKLEECEGE